MRNLLRFLARNYFFILFLVLEVLSLSLVVNYNNFQRVKFFNSSNSVVAGIYGRFNKVSNFFKLQQTNAELAAENASLRNELARRLQPVYPDSLRFERDSVMLADPQYAYTPARVVNNSVIKQYNYITINRGSKDGVKVDMGIIGPSGVVGIITSVSKNYATGPTVLNKRWKVSAKIKSSNYFGSLAWDGINMHLANLNEIPFHVRMEIGDTVVTSGFSGVFPEGIPVGVIEEFDHATGHNFYDIRVRLLTDFSKLSFVEVVRNNQLDELKFIQKQNTNE
ncbi:MAG: rod shape-determining protein MreC [Mangrovibacterium sp.]